MIQSGTKIYITDNTGIKIGKMIGKLGQNKRTATIGDVITFSVRQSLPGSNYKKGDIVKGVLVRTKYPIKNFDNSYLKFDDNSVVVVDDKRNPVGTRIIGPIAYKIKQKKFHKIISLAPELV
jgi:large subunit ribosomal protein L14